MPSDVVRKRTHGLVALSLFIAISGSSAYGDEPLLPPKNFEARSPNGQCRAYADLAASQITGSRIDHKKVLWVIPEYQQVMRLADDCQSVMALYRGESLITSPDHQPSTIVMSFFRSGELVGRVRLGELYPDIDSLPQTVSHRIWMKDVGWENGRWFILAVDGRKIFFDPALGQRID